MHQYTCQPVVDSIHLEHAASLDVVAQLSAITCEPYVLDQEHLGKLAQTFRRHSSFVKCVVQDDPSPSMFWSKITFFTFLWDHSISCMWHLTSDI